MPIASKNSVFTIHIRKRKIEEHYIIYKFSFTISLILTTEPLWVFHVVAFCLLINGNFKYYSDDPFFLDNPLQGYNLFQSQLFFS
jgi:hypothetical protein